jgi:hypothetical protein
MQYLMHLKLRIPLLVVCVAAGLDYTVAHYGIITSSPRLDAVLTFVDDATPDAADNWAVGEVRYLTGL